MSDCPDRALLAERPYPSRSAGSDFSTPAADPLGGSWFEAGSPFFDAVDTTERLRKIIDGLPEQVAIMDADWNILMVNKAWNDLVPEVSHPMGPGDNYRDFCEGYAAEGNKDAALVLAGLDRLSVGIGNHFRHIYSAEGNLAGHDFQICLSTFQSGGRRLATATRYDVTDILDRRRRHLNGTEARLRIRQDERRRIGRELHDSTAQLLVALHISVARLKQIHEDRESLSLFGEIDETIGRVHREIRAISYLFHPPELEAGGLASALRTMASGFGKRSGLHIGVRVEGELDWMAEVVEATLYRLCQEALANIHRHAQAVEVGIRLVGRKGLLHLLIEDDGIGVPDGARPSGVVGVGIPGMRARVRELGGRFSVRRRECGTLVMASVPLRRDAEE